MSFIFRDYLSPAVAISNVQFTIYRTFKKAFPVINVDGIDVYKDHINFYNKDAGGITDSVARKRFAQKLGISWDEIENQDYEGIQTLFITFDSKKYNFASKEKSEIVNDLDLRFNVDDEFSLKINYGAESLRYFEDHDLIINDINVLINKLDSNPKLYYANIDKLSDTKNFTDIPGNKTKNNQVPPISIKAENFDWQSLALLDDGTHFERTNVRNIEIKTTNTGLSGKLIQELSFIIDFKVISEITNENSQLINYCKEISDVLEESTTFNSKLKLINTALQNAYKAAPNSLIKESLINMQPYDDTVFYQNYLRVDAVANMKKADFVKLLSSTAKIDITEVEAPWWKKALLVLVVIAASAIALASGGSLSGLMLLATQLGTFSISLTIGMLIVNEIGPAGSLGAWGRIIGKMAQISGIAASVLGAYAAIQNLVSQAAKGLATVTTEQIKAGAQGIKNIYNTYENLENKDENIIEEEYEDSTLKANDIIAYQDLIMENDALHQISLQKEQMFGGNMTEALLQKQIK